MCHCLLDTESFQKGSWSGTYQIAGLDIFNAKFAEDYNTAHDGFILDQFEYVYITGQHQISAHIFFGSTFTGLIVRLDDEYSVLIHSEPNPTPK